VARVKVDLPDEYIRKLNELGNKVDGAAERILLAGANAVMPEFIQNANRVIGHNTKYKSRTKGNLIKSITTSHYKISKYGNYYIRLIFDGEQDGISNNDLAYIIEYGKSGQPAKPFIEVTKRKTWKQCNAAMLAQLKKELGV